MNNKTIPLTYKKVKTYLETEEVGDVVDGVEMYTSGQQYSS